MGKLLRFLVLACVVQAAGAQGLFKGFIPDENGTNLDSPIQKQKLAPGSIIKDCPDCPEMVVVPAGSFLMGSDGQHYNQRPPHSVNIRSFLIGQTEVTQEQWESVTGDNPSQKRGRRLPVEQVSWPDVQEFITKLNQKTGQRYRLPSEAEWEYAARAGSTGRWSFGDSSSMLDNYAWHVGNSGYETHAVRQKIPNEFGLFDMHGNVWEWTEDCWHTRYFGAPTDGSAWITGCEDNWRVFRGGSYGNYPSYLQSAERNRDSPSIRFNFLGLRLARDL